MAPAAKAPPPRPESRLPMPPLAPLPCVAPVFFCNKSWPDLSSWSSNPRVIIFRLQKRVHPDTKATSLDSKVPGTPGEFASRCCWAADSRGRCFSWIGQGYPIVSRVDRSGCSVQQPVLPGQQVVSDLQSGGSGRSVERTDSHHRFHAWRTAAFRRGPRTAMQGQSRAGNRYLARRLHDRTLEMDVTSPCGSRRQTTPGQAK